MKKTYDEWINSISEEDIVEILYEYYLCLLEEECSVTDTCGVCPTCLQNEAAKKFHIASIIDFDDREIAEIGYEFLLTNFPDAISKEVKQRLKQLNILELKRRKVHGHRIKH